MSTDKHPIPEAIVELAQKIGDDYSQKHEAEFSPRSATAGMECALEMWRHLSSQPSPGLRPIPSVGDFKRLCWIAWRHGSIGSGSSIREDQEGFRDWWENDAEFLLHHLPVEPKPDFDEKAEEQQPIEGEQKSGIDIIARERQKQIEKHGYDYRHDAQHCNGQLLDAAVAYINANSLYDYNENKRDLSDFGNPDAPEILIPVGWPFKPESYKGDGDDRISQLAKAAAFLAAEIDRLQNIQPSAPPEAQPIADKAILTIIVNGYPTGIETRDDEAFGPIIEKELVQTYNTARPAKEWTLRTHGGEPINSTDTVGDLDEKDGKILFLSLSAGIGADDKEVPEEIKAKNK